MWIQVEDKLPPVNTLVLVIQGGAVHLRSHNGSGDWYDEYETLDDSEIPVEEWHPIPQ